MKRCQWYYNYFSKTQKKKIKNSVCSATYGIRIHPDGSLVCSTDLGGIARLWDLRMGRCIIPLQGHNDQILSCDFNPYGYQLATCSDDNTVRIWDLRKKKCLTTVLAHNKTISEVQYDKSGKFFITSSYDATLKIFSANNFQCKKVLVGHEARIMGSDICPVERNGQVWIGSVASDRTFKLWGTSGENPCPSGSGVKQEDNGTTAMEM